MCVSPISIPQSLTTAYNYIRMFARGWGIYIVGCAFVLSACSLETAPVTPNIVVPAVTVYVSPGATIYPTPAATLFVSPVPPRPQSPTPIPPPSRTPTPTTRPTSTPIPTPTISPFAVRVNGIGITKERVAAELRRQMAAHPEQHRSDSKEYAQLSTRLRDNIIDALVEQALLVNVATQNDIKVTLEEVDKALEELIKIRGGREAFEAWLKTYRQTEQDMQDVLQRELLAQAVRNWVLKDFKSSAEYVRAAHIVVGSDAEAKRVLARLQREDFAQLAQTLSLDNTSRGSGGDLGWFARGTGVIVWPEIEDAAFKLSVNQISQVVRSPIGFHIIKVTGKETRELSPDDAAKLQQTMLEEWMNKLKSSAKIERFP